MGQDKLALPVLGRPMVGHAVQAATEAGTIAHNPGGRPVVPPPPSLLPLTVVQNPHAGSRSVGSLIAGLLALPADAAGVVVLLGDMPLVRAHHITRLLAAFRSHAVDRSICVPVWQERRGNPVVLGRGFRAELLTLRGDVGAKSLMTAYPRSRHRSRHG